MKASSALAIVFTLLLAGSTLADADNSNKDHGKNTSNADGNGDGHSGGNGNGNANGDGGGGKNPPDAAGTSDQNGALRAVQSGAALPLSVIVDLAQKNWPGRVIDAKLVRFPAGLLYQLTILSDDGVSRRVYYDAHSARPAEGR